MGVVAIVRSPVAAARAPAPGADSVAEAVPVPSTAVIEIAPGADTRPVTTRLRLSTKAMSPVLAVVGPRVATWLGLGSAMLVALLVSRVGDDEATGLRDGAIGRQADSPTGQCAA